MAASQRWSAFSFSLILHASVIGLLTWIDIAFPPAASPRYEVLVIPDRSPHDSKIIWYDFRKAVPEVTPDRPFGPATTPQGEKDPTRTLIAVSPNARSIRQVIRQPDQPKLLPVDVPAPNLVAIAVKLPPKVFVPPAPSKRPQTAAPAAPVDTPVPLDLPRTQAANTLGAMASLRKLPPRPFVAPPARGGARATAHVDVPDSPQFDARANAVSGLQAVIVGLNPGTALPPPGSRPAQIARAPEAGTPSSGARLGSAPVVPGLLSHGRPGEPPAPAPSQIPPPIPGQGAPREIVLPGVNRTMSAPLRPSARVIPAGVEAKFSYRNVYTLVIPGPAVPGYAGDWVMWFAEHDPPEISSGPRILAPIPARKYPPAGDPAVAGTPVSVTYRFSASIDRTGRVTSASVLWGSPDPALRRRALEELKSWEFAPALRNGEPMDVDVVIEIPFRFGSAGQTPR